MYETSQKQPESNDSSNQERGRFVKHSILRKGHHHHLQHGRAKLPRSWEVGFRAASNSMKLKWKLPHLLGHTAQVVQLKWSVIVLTNMNKWLIISSPTFSVTILLASLLSLATCPSIEAPKMGSTISGKGNHHCKGRVLNGNYPPSLKCFYHVFIPSPKVVATFFLPQETHHVLPRVILPNHTLSHGIGWQGCPTVIQATLIARNTFAYNDFQK